MSLEIKNLNVKLQNNHILQNINLDLNSGEFISLIGPSGCGKSTLLKSIGGLLEINSGEIFINDNLVNDIPPEKRGAIIVFQDLRLFPHMTVEENIAFSMNIKKVPKDAQKLIISKLLDDVQLKGFNKRKIHEMSGGQLQRVALARALASKPNILLLDEPFSGLDEKLRTEMRTLVVKLHKENNLTTILVTHDKREAMEISNRVAIMSKGVILEYNSPVNILKKENHVNVKNYFGNINYINGKVLNGKFISNSLQWDVDLEDGNYKVAISDNGKGLTYLKI